MILNGDYVAASRGYFARDISRVSQWWRGWKSVLTSMRVDESKGVELKAPHKRPSIVRPMNVTGRTTNNRLAGGETADCFDDANSGQTALQ